MAQCTAKSKRSQQRCRQSAMHGKTVCAIHGGKTPSGFGLPQTKTGKYSRVLPIALAARYHEGIANPELLSVRDDIAVAESRLADLFARLDGGESGQLWRDLRQALTFFETALATGDRGGLHGALETMRRLITRGTSDYAAWEDIHRTWIARCRLTETEHKTLMVQQQMVTVEQLNVYLALVTHALQQSVAAHTDQDTARAILGAAGTELKKLVALGDRGPMGPAAQA